MSLMLIESGPLILTLMTIQIDLKQAKRKEGLDFKQDVELNVLTDFLGECKRAAREQNTVLEALPEKTIVKLLRRYVKTAGETAGLSKDEVIVKQATAERDFLSRITPLGMAAEDIITIVRGLLDKNPTAGIGSIIQYFKQTYDGEYNPATLSSITKREIEHDYT